MSLDRLLHTGRYIKKKLYIYIMGIKNRQAMAGDHWEWWKTVWKPRSTMDLVLEKKNKFYAPSQ